MSTTTYGWLVLALPLLGTLVVSLGYSPLQAVGGRTAGWIATGAIFLSFLAAVGALLSLQGHAPEHRQLVSSLWDYASTVGINAQMSILVDPLSVFMILIVTGVSTMIHLYSISYMDRDRGYRALLRLPELLRLLDAAAGAGRQLPAADRRLGVRRRRLLPADLLLVPAHHRDARGNQGVRDQRRRRRRPRARHVLHLQAHPHARLPAELPPRRSRRLRAGPEPGRPRRRVRAAARGSVRQVRADPAAHVAARTRWRAPRRSAR